MSNKCISMGSSSTFQWGNIGVLYVLAYVEDIYIRVLSLLVSILNPYLVSFIFVLNTCDDYGYLVCSTVFMILYTNKLCIPSDPRTIRTSLFPLQTLNQKHM